MNKLYLTIFLGFLFSFGFFSCQSNNKVSNNVKDSLLALNSSDSSILSYALGLEKLSESLEKEESPVYSKGDYSFYTEIYNKDSIPVIYKEFGDSGDYGFVNKKYYLDKDELVLYIEKTKQASGGEKPNYEYKETRIFFRNNVFLRADERKSESDSLLNQTPFTQLDENLVDKNQQFNFQKMADAAKSAGEFNLVFNRIDSVSSKKSYLILSSGAYEAAYQFSKPDSLITQIKAAPSAYKGRKLDFEFSRQGTNMIYKKGKSVF